MQHSPREPGQETRRRFRRGVRGQALDVLVHCFADSVGADSAMLVERSRAGKSPRLLAAFDRDAPRATAPWTPQSLVGRALEADAALVEGTPGEDGDHLAAVAAPVRSATGALGAIHAGFASPSHLAPAEVRWRADSFARLAALCLEGDLALPALLGASGYDALTGCLTYAGVIDVLRAEIQRSRRRNHTVSCAFIDLDGFKLVNDDRGHLEGNRVLTAVGVALRDHARSYDAIGRFGGDEFVVVLPETDTKAARTVAERLRAGARAAIAAETTVPIDISIGIAEWDGESTPTQLLDAADRSLSTAKKNGGAAVATLPSRAPRLNRVLAATQGIIRLRQTNGNGDRPVAHRRRTGLPRPPEQDD